MLRCILITLGILAFFSSRSYSMPGTWFEDQLIHEANVIAIIDIDEGQFVKEAGTLLTSIKDLKEVHVALTIYHATVSETIKGKISSEPFIAQFDGDGSDMNRFEPGRYIAFLRESGGLYFPLTTYFRITEGSLSWYRLPFRGPTRTKRRGDYGPYFEKTPVSKAVADIKAILKEKRK